MIITCPACATRYTISDDTVGLRARKVRCAKCAHEWVFKPSAENVAEDISEPEVLPPEPESRAQDPAGSSASAVPAAKSVRDMVTVAESPKRSLARFDRVAAVLIAVVVLAAVAAAAIAFRSPIARAWPPAAGLYATLGFKVNVLGLEIRNTNWQIARRNGLPVLTVTGEVVNVSGHELGVPLLHLTLRDNKARALYQWSAVLKAKRLKPGEAVQFTEVRQSPPLEAHDVEIRFETGT